MCTLTSASWTVYMQEDQSFADVLSLTAFLANPLYHLQHMLHRLLPSHLVLILNSSLLPQPTPSSLTASVLSPSQPQPYNTPINKLRLVFPATPWRSRFTSFYLPLLVSILTLCGDIITNPGPPALSSFSLSIYSIRSLTITYLP